MNLKEQYIHVYTAITGGEIPQTDTLMQPASFLLGNFQVCKGCLSCTWINFVIFCVPLFAAAAGLSFMQIVYCPAFCHLLTIKIKFDEDV